MRILIADDNYEIRSALRLLIEQEPGMSVVTEAVDTTTLLASADATQPDLILVDWELPGAVSGNGNLFHALRCVDSNTVLVSMSSRMEDRLNALTCGADSFVCKGDEPGKLLAVLRKYNDDGLRGGKD